MASSKLVQISKEEKRGLKCRIFCNNFNINKTLTFSLVNLSKYILLTTMYLLIQYIRCIKYVLKTVYIITIA